MNLGQARAVMSGAARGLGRCFALALAREGARVLAGDVNAAGLRSLKSEAEAERGAGAAAEVEAEAEAGAGAGMGDGMGAGARPVPGSLSVASLDVASERSVVEFVERAAGELGGIDVLINNAGVLRDGLLVAVEEGGLRKLPLLQWNKVIEVNLSGQFLMAREVAARMIASGTRGVIVNVSSLARSGNRGQSSYSASKAGLDACTRAWALELAPHGIRVGGVAPGVIDTPILAGVSGPALQALAGGDPAGQAGHARRGVGSGALHPELRVLHRAHDRGGRRREHGMRARA